MIKRLQCGCERRDWSEKAQVRHACAIRSVVLRGTGTCLAWPLAWLGQGLGNKPNKAIDELLDQRSTRPKSRVPHVCDAIGCVVGFGKLHCTAPAKCQPAVRGLGCGQPAHRPALARVNC